MTFTPPLTSIAFTDEDLRLFLERITYYFKALTNESPAPATPYLKERDQNLILDHTGVISIAGRYQGNIIFTAEIKFLSHFFSRIGLTSDRTDLIQDSVGEIANTVAGNLQEKFGGEFIITPPRLYTGQTAELQETLQAKKGYILPITWNHGKARLIALFD